MSSGLCSLLVNSRDDPANSVRINSRRALKPVQRVPFEGNLACELLFFDGQPLRAACPERVNYIMAKVAPSGITGNTSFGRFLIESGPAAISMQAIDKLFGVTGTRRHGLFTIDLREDAGGNPEITEINVRNVAFNGCSAQLGANFSEDIVRLLLVDPEFDRAYRQYDFDDDYVFIRDVDVEPIILRESNLLVGGK